MVAFGIAGVNDGFCAERLLMFENSGAAAINASVKERSWTLDQFRSRSREVPERSGCVAHHVDREERSDGDADCVLGGYWSRDLRRASAFRSGRRRQRSLFGGFAARRTGGVRSDHVSDGRNRDGYRNRANGSNRPGRSGSSRNAGNIEKCARRLFGDSAAI